MGAKRAVQAMRQTWFDSVDISTRCRRCEHVPEKDSKMVSCMVPGRRTLGKGW